MPTGLPSALTAIWIHDSPDYIRMASHYKFPGVVRPLLQCKTIMVEGIVKTLYKSRLYV